MQHYPPTIVVSSPIPFDHQTRGRSLQSKVTHSRIFHSPTMVTSNPIQQQHLDYPMKKSNFIRDSSLIGNSSFSNQQRVIYKTPEILRVMQTVGRNHHSQIDKLKQMNAFIMDNYAYLYQEYSQLEKNKNIQEVEVIDENKFLRTAILKIQQIINQQMQLSLHKINSIGKDVHNNIPNQSNKYYS